MEIVSFILIIFFFTGLDIILIRAIWPGAFGKIDKNKDKKDPPKNEWE